MKSLWLLASIALVTTLGCNQQDRPTTIEPERRTEAPPAATSSRVPESETTASELPKMSEADRALAQQVEQALREDKVLASAAQNILIHCNNGQVTLRGSVNSQKEKKELEDKAQQVTGVTKVHNQL